MRSLLIFSFIIAQTTSIFAQKKIKYETVFFEDKTEETSNARFTLENGVSEKEFIKAKLKVTNYTDKTLVIKPEECFYTSPKGEIASRDKWLIVAPRQQEDKTIDVKGESIKTDSTTLKIKGFYICSKSEKISTQAMSLPPEKELTVGNFRLELDGWDRDGKEIMIKYKIRYVGEKIGNFDPGKVTLKSAEGNTYKNQKGKNKSFSFKKNDDYLIGFLFLSDSKKENTLIWNDAFSEAEPEKLEEVDITITMNLAKTKDKN